MTERPPELVAVLAQAEAYYTATVTFMRDYQRLETDATPLPPNVTLMPWAELTESHQLLYAELANHASHTLVMGCLRIAGLTETQALTILKGGTPS